MQDTYRLFDDMMNLRKVRPEKLISHLSRVYQNNLLHRMGIYILKGICYEKNQAHRFKIIFI